MKVVGYCVFGFLGVCILPSAALVGRESWVNAHRIEPAP